MNVLRQPATPAPAVSGPGPVYLFDEFQLDAHARILTRDGLPVGLGSRAVQLLVALIENRDRVVAKQELIRTAWPRSTVVENSLSVAICTLRQAFGGRFYIRNEYGKGYRFVAPVALASDSPNPASRHGSPAPIPVIVPASEPPSIAVLPFIDAGGDPDAGLFGEGISEDIIGALSRNRWLRVIARNSSFSYKPGAARVGEIAQQLRVRYVLEGSIRHSGDRVRVIAHLTDAVTQTHLVTERHDRVLADIFTVQDEIAARIAQAVRPVLLEAEQDRSFCTHPDSVDAWLAYQRGVWFLSQRDPDQLRTSMDWFQRAISLAPRYAPGYYGLARLLCRAGTGYSPAAPPDWQGQAERLAQQAVQLDSRDSSAHATLGYARYARGDHAGAMTAADSALRLNPSDASAYATLGAAQVFGGAPAEGIDALHASIDLDPRDPRVRVRQMQLGLGFYFLRDLQAAEAHAAMMLRAWPEYFGSHRLMAMILAETGRAVEARPFLSESRALEPEAFANFTRSRVPWYRAEDFRRVLAAFRAAGWQPSTGDAFS